MLRARGGRLRLYFAEVKEFLELALLTGALALHPADFHAQFSDSVNFVCVASSKNFASGAIQALHQDESGFLWIGSTSGLYRYDGNTLVSIGQNDSELQGSTPVNVIEIEQDAKGTLWFGTKDAGLLFYDTVCYTLRPFPVTEKSEWMKGMDIRAIVWDSAWIWLGSQDGLIRLESGTQEVIRYRVVEDAQSPDQKRQNIIRQVRHDPWDRDRLWFSTLSGLYSFHKVTGRIDSHWCRDYPVLYPLHDESDGQYMYAGFEWHQTHWLLGSWGGGHYRYNPVSREWSRSLFQAKNAALPLSDNVVLQYEQLNDSQYVFTGSSLGVLNISTLECELLWLEMSDTAVHSSQYTEALLIDRSGYLWVGSRKGLYRTDQPVASRKPNRDRMYFHDVRIDGIKVTDSVLATGHIRMAPHQQGIHIRFGLIRISGNDSVEYSCRLEGVSRDWISTNPATGVFYQDLQGGTNRFIVRARNSDGTLISESDLLIDVQKYFYRQWWFWGLIGLCVFVVITAIVIWRIRLLKSKYQQQAFQEARLVQSEMRALRAQLNPHFLFNSLNSIKHFIITNEPRSATRYLNKFAALMRLTLDNSRHSFISLEHEIEFLSLFLELERVRLGGKMNYEMIIEPGLSVSNIEIPPMVIQPFLENAIWHGIVNKPDNGHVWIRFRTIEDSLEIVVEDNGIGRDASAAIQGEHKTRKSMGMKLIRERLELIEKLYKTGVTINVHDLVDGSGRASGTSVQIRLPLQYRIHENGTQGDHH